MANGVFSMELLHRLMADVERLPPSPTLNPFFGTPIANAFGMPVRASEAFPTITQCSKCGGTGSGGERATYCQTCKGGGKIRNEGVIVERDPTMPLFGKEPKVDGGQMTVIVSYFQRKFEPSFPFALPPRPWPGFVSVDTHPEGGDAKLGYVHG